MLNTIKNGRNNLNKKGSCEFYRYDRLKATIDIMLQYLGNVMKYNTNSFKDLDQDIIIRYRSSIK